MEIALTILFGLLVFFQFIVYTVRIAKVKKTWLDWLIFILIAAGGALLARNYGSLLVQKGDGAPLSLLLLTVIGANVLAALVYTLLPFLLLDRETRRGYHSLPGPKPELLGAASILFCLLVLTTIARLAG